MHGVSVHHPALLVEPAGRFRHRLDLDAIGPYVGTRRSSGMSSGESISTSPVRSPYGPGDIGRHSEPWWASGLVSLISRNRPRYTCDDAGTRHHGMNQSWNVEPSVDVSGPAIVSRAVLRIVLEREEAGVITRHREGRTNRYAVHPRRHLRRPVEGRCSVGDLLQMTDHPGDQRPKQMSAIEGSPVGETSR